MHDDGIEIWRKSSSTIVWLSAEGPLSRVEWARVLQIITALRMRLSTVREGLTSACQSGRDSWRRPLSSPFDRVIVNHLGGQKSSKLAGRGNNRYKGVEARKWTPSPSCQRPVWLNIKGERWGVVVGSWIWPAPCWMLMLEGTKVAGTSLGIPGKLESCSGVVCWRGGFPGYRPPRSGGWWLVERTRITTVPYLCASLKAQVHCRTMKALSSSRRGGKSSFPTRTSYVCAFIFTR